MDRDKLGKEIERLQDVLRNLDPNDEVYGSVVERIIKLTKLQMEYDELCDKQIDRQNRFELDQEKSNEQIELEKEKLEMSIRLEEKKFEKDLMDVARQRKITRWQAIWDLVKILLTTGCTVALIVVTGRIEQSAILGQHQWSLIPKLFKSFG